jgi:hypothetical protein
MNEFEYCILIMFIPNRTTFFAIYEQYIHLKKLTIFIVRLNLTQKYEKQNNGYIVQVALNNVTIPNSLFNYYLG